MRKFLVFIGLLGFLLLVYFVSFRQALLYIVGLGYGVVLAGASFGFTTGWRRYIERKETEGLAAQWLLILILFILSAPIILLFPQVTPANASISFSLLMGAFVFGIFMQLADGCGSGTLFKAGGLKTYNLLVLFGFILGAYWGSADIPYWLSWGILFPAFNLIRDGLFGSSYLGIWGEGIVIAGIFFHFICESSISTNKELKDKKNKMLKGAVVLAFLAWLNLVIAGQPWGIVYGLGLWGAKLVEGIGFSVADNLYWQSGYHFESLRRSLLLDSVSITNIGLLLGALYIALTKSKSTLSASHYLQTSRSYQTQIYLVLFKFLTIIIVGVVLGYSSRMAFGCNIGAFVSGISTGSLHGWVWMVMAFSGSVIGVRLRRTQWVCFLQS